jgi:hypothetical protein
MTEEQENSVDWEDYVRSEVSALLDTILPSCKEGGLVINYKKAIKERTEAGPVYKDNKVSGIEIVLDFNFMEDIEKPV